MRLFFFLIYLVFALQVWRHVGWWARENHTSCLCYSRRSTRPCIVSGIHDYGWTLIACVAVWWGIVFCWAIRSISIKYGLTEKNIGFFKPSPLVESREDKITRLEQEAYERERYIRKMEIENGIGV